MAGACPGITLLFVIFVFLAFLFNQNHVHDFARAQIF